MSLLKWIRENREQFDKVMDRREKSPPMTEKERRKIKKRRELENRRGKTKALKEEYGEKEYNRLTLINMKRLGISGTPSDLDKSDSDSDDEEIPKTRMKTKKIVKRKLPEVHKDLDKYIKNFDLSIDKSLKPKKRLMTTTKIVKSKPKGRLMTTTKIVEYKPKNISEEKPKGNELNKVIELLEKMNQTKDIMNAIKYVKNFIKNN